MAAVAAILGPEGQAIGKPVVSGPLQGCCGPTAAGGTGSGGEGHAHTEAYVDSRWIVMDTTWDSNNEYRGGSYQTEAPSGFCYFDIAPEAFALDHKTTSRDQIVTFLCRALCS